MRRKPAKSRPMGEVCPWREAARRFSRDPAAMAGLLLLLVVVCCCLCAPLLTPYGYADMDVSARLARSSAAHPFGTDYAGRDLLARVLYGGRTTLRIAGLSTALAALLGTSLGLLAGFRGGRADLLLMRFSEVLSAVPSLLLIILAEGLLGWGEGNFLYALALAALPSMLRLTRTSVLEIMGRDYVAAARALGVSGPGILRRHVLPNLLPSLLVHLTSGLGEAILTCSVMSFIGIGVNPPRPEWGNLVYEGYSTLRSYPHTALFPAAAVILCVLAVNLTGGGLRDALEGGEAHG